MQYQNGVDMHFDWGASQFLKAQVGYSRSIGAFRLAALYQFGGLQPGQRSSNGAIEGQFGGALGP
jgi:hypothetical protein